MTTPAVSLNYKNSANLLFSTKFAGLSVDPLSPGALTLNAPDTFAGAGVWRHIVGTDPVTGFSHTDLAASPLFVVPPGGGVTGNGGYGLYYINQVTSPPWATNDLAGVEAKCPTTTGTATVRGTTTNYIKTHWNDSGEACTGPNGGFRTQLWFTFYRNLALANVDMTTICIRKWIYLQDHSTMFDATCRFRSLFDMKTDTDFRYQIALTKSNGGSSGWPDEPPATNNTVGWLCSADNIANVLPPEEFWRMKNFTVPVPVNEVFQLEIYWKRATSYTDNATGRFRVVMRKQDGTEYVLFDVNPKTVADYNATYYSSPGPLNWARFPMTNTHMGVNGGYIQRLFASGCYFGGVANQTPEWQCHGISIFDDIPYHLPPP